MKAASVSLVAIAAIVVGAPVRAGSIHPSRHHSVGGRQSQIQSNEVYYDKVYGAWQKHTAQFDKAHPFYGQVFSRPELFNTLLTVYHAHPARFALYHACLARVLSGGEARRRHHEILTPPQLPAVSGEELTTPPSPPNSPPIIATPEPSSVMLFATAAVGFTLFPGTRRWMLSGLAGVGKAEGGPGEV
jgi:hypothetical protein